MGTDGQGRAGECASRGPGGLPRPAVTECLGFQLACFPCPLPSVAPAGLPSESSEHLESGAARRGGRSGGGRGTLCSSGAPMDSPPGPPRRTANQNHSARMGTRRAPSCSQRPPGGLTRCQASLAAQHRAGDTPGPTPPTPYHPQRHHQWGTGSPQLNEASTCCRLAAYIRRLLWRGPAPSLCRAPPERRPPGGAVRPPQGRAGLRS